MLCIIKGKKSGSSHLHPKNSIEKRGGKEAKEKIRHTTEPGADTKCYTCHFHPVPTRSTTTATYPPPPTPITLFHGAYYVSRPPCFQRDRLCCPDHYQDELCEDQLRGEKTPHYHHSGFCEHMFTTLTLSTANSMLQGTVCEKTSQSRTSHHSQHPRASGGTPAWFATCSPAHHVPNLRWRAG